MHHITTHSAERAADAAVHLWALASTQFPRQHHLILEAAQSALIDVVSSFALNARRAMEILPVGAKFALRQPRWQWSAGPGEETVTDLRDALNRIVHAQELHVRLVELPASLSVMEGGAVVVPFVQARTDRKPLACIDPFALSHAYMYDVLPRLARPDPGSTPAPAVH
jgi:hypothetical protein